MSNRSGHRDRLWLFLGFGFFSLSAEMVWMRLLSTILGSERISVYYTTAGFFLGVALGAWLLNGRIYASRSPLKWFGTCGVLAGAYTVMSPPLFHSLNDIILPGPTFIWALIILLPGSACFGGMFTAMMSMSDRQGGNTDSRRAGILYALETLGGAIGIFLLLFGIIPFFGVQAAASTSGVTGIVVGGLAIWRSRNNLQGGDVEGGHANNVIPGILLFLLGFIGLSLQVHLLNVLGQTLSNTVYTFGTALIIYLAGTSIGAGIQSRVCIGVSLPGLFMIYLAAVGIAGWGPVKLPGWVILDTKPEALSHIISRECIILSATFLPPAIVSGSLFVRLLAFYLKSHAGLGLAINSLGAALGPIVLVSFGHAVLGYTGTYFALLILIFLGAVLAVKREPLSSKKKWVGGLAIASAIFVLSPRNMDQVGVQNGWTEKARHQSLFGTVLVTEKQGLARLQLNHYLMGGQLGFGEARMGHLGLLTHPNPKRVLVLGMGSGVTAGAALAYEIEQLDVVDIVPELQNTLSAFDRFNNELASDQRVTIHSRDARSFLRESKETYDVIIADLFHPARDGASSLYAAEHYALIQSRLNAQGVFVQWLPLYQLSTRNLQSIMRTAQSVFPEIEGMLGLYNRDYALLGLVSAKSAPDYNVIRKTTGLGRTPSRYVDGPRDWASCFWLKSEDILRLSEGAFINSDLHPQLNFSALDILIREQSQLSRSNLDWLIENRSTPWHWKKKNSSDMRFKQYSEAATHYLSAEKLRQQESYEPQSLVDLYLSAYQASPEFKPVHGKLYGIARQQPLLADYIYPKMLSMHPMERKPYTLYLQHLKITGQGKRYGMVVQEYARRFGATDGLQ